MMAAVVMISIPLLIIFAVFRKQIMSGVSKSGLKG
jgi:multiple sugar transport system permease protein